VNPSEHLAFELEIEKLKFNTKLQRLDVLLKRAIEETDKEKIFLIKETVRKIQAQIDAIDKELSRRKQ
jgi:hypothetical protein